MKNYNEEIKVVTDRGLTISAELPYGIDSAGFLRRVVSIMEALTYAEESIIEGMKAVLKELEDEPN